MKRILVWAAVIILAAGAGLFARENIVTLARVTGDSMSPTLVTGDIVLITKFDYKTSPPARFDVVQAVVPGRDGTYLKRVIGLPGERVEIKDGVVHINGQALYEKYAAPSDDEMALTLGADEYFLMGDNREASYDSREEDFGAVSADCFCGRVRAVLFPEFGVVAGQ